jgi:hypothetical protein
VGAFGREQAQRGWAITMMQSVGRGLFLRRWLLAGVVGCVLWVSLLFPVGAMGIGPDLNVYRFYNMKNGVHFYTASIAERNSVVTNLSGTYKYEGVAYSLNTLSPVNHQPLYRFYNFKKGFHFYTASDSERDSVINNLSGTYRYEGVAYKVSPTYTTVVHAESAVWRFYNKSTGSHFYTYSQVERDNVIATLAGTYKYEGVAFWTQPF